MTGNKKKKKKKTPYFKSRKQCEKCGNCNYVGEGGFLCDVHMEIVIDDFAPTFEYLCCGGKDFTPQ